MEVSTFNKYHVSKPKLDCILEKFTEFCCVRPSNEDNHSDYSCLEDCIVYLS